MTLILGRSSATEKYCCSLLLILLIIDSVTVFVKYVETCTGNIVMLPLMTNVDMVSQTVDDFLASATMNLDLPRVQELLKDPNINVNFKNKVVSFLYDEHALTTLLEW